MNEVSINDKLERLIKVNGLKKWRVAKLVNMRDTYFSAKLRNNLTEKEVDRILKAIDELINEQLEVLKKSHEEIEEELQHREEYRQEVKTTEKATN